MTYQVFSNNNNLAENERYFLVKQYDPLIYFSRMVDIYGDFRNFTVSSLVSSPNIFCGCFIMISSVDVDNPQRAQVFHWSSLER